MVHGFVQQSLGRLTIESRPGGGTTVSMLFPASSGEAGEFGGEAGGDPRIGHETILVAEDSDDVRALARDYLESSATGSSWPATATRPCGSCGPAPPSTCSFPTS